MSTEKDSPIRISVDIPETELEEFLTAEQLIINGKSFISKEYVAILCEKFAKKENKELIEKYETTKTLLYEGELKIYDLQHKFSSNNSWISVKEINVELLENEAAVLIQMSKFGNPMYQVIGYYKDGQWLSEHNDKDLNDNINLEYVSHYCVLPQPPTND